MQDSSLAKADRGAITLNGDLNGINPAVHRPSSYDIHPNPTSLAFHNVAWSTPGPHPKQVLHGISGSVHPGELLAIMGPSGAGKTSLIQILSGRSQPSPGSSVVLNNRPMDKQGRRSISYVMQNDVLLANLTVRETLRYAALLKLPRHYTREMKLRRVEHVIDELGLRKAADTMIGNDIKRGVSGGEKKRVNVGVELMAEPAIMILDGERSCHGCHDLSQLTHTLDTEPTSGLDSSTALSLMKMLRQLASNEQRTVRTKVVSLYQLVPAYRSMLHPLP
jgi:ABC-type multidrug transport system ATPase subunit